MSLAAPESVLSLQGIRHAYLGRTVLRDISLSMRAGEILALIGPSGCGKSTLAHIAAGLIAPQDGRVARCYARHGMVFQDTRLLPWATARDNIAYPLKLADTPKSQHRTKVQEAAAMVALDDKDLDKYPVELSGGMRQRTAIARALVLSPDMMYFDEPFTALDVALKRRMQDLVIQASQALRFAALFITHDLTEATRIAHRVAVMDSHGRGIIGIRSIDGQPGQRSDGDIFRQISNYLDQDPLFRHIHDVDERRLP